MHIARPAAAFSTEMEQREEKRKKEETKKESYLTKRAEKYRMIARINNARFVKIAPQRCLLSMNKRTLRWPLAVFGK